MKSLRSTLRLVAPLVVVFCFLCAGSQSLQAQQTISFPNFSSTANLRINGSAGVATDAQVLRLTPSLDGQVGSAWYATSLSLKSGFTTTFTFRLSNPRGIGPADGIAFVIQNGSFQANGTSGSLAIGSPAFSGGGAIGFQDLTHSLAVELDTFCNSQNSDTCVGNEFSTANEVAILSCGSAANSADHALCGITQADVPSPIFADGGVHTMVITYTPPGECTDCTTLRVTLDETQVLTAHVDLASLGLDPSQDAFVGFTAATGAGEEDQDILSWSFTSTQSQVTGAPISGDNLAQTITFNNNIEGQNGDQYILDYRNASGTITANNNATPFITNLQITPADWPTFVRGTPFATTMCISVNGANGNCTAKKQVCTTPALTTPAGDNCPQSSDRNILLSARFDAPTITDPATIFGVVEGTDDWAGGVCHFVPGSPEGPLPCPQGGLVEFKGPGEYTGRKGGASTNSTYTWVTGVRPPSTVVTSGFVNGAGWTNSPNPTGTFTASPATLLNPSNPSDPINNGMTVAPIDSITYGANAASSGLPSTLLPVPGDVTIFSPNPPGNATSCPSIITPATVANPFTQTVAVGPFADGSSNLLHYFTRDCAGTNELSFTEDVNNIWSTHFKSITINVDLTKPAVSSGPTLSPAPTTNNGVPNSYLLNQAVTATYTCQDPLPSGGGLASGLATCNSAGISGAPASATFTNPVATSATGSFNFTVAGPTDVAGNTGLPASVPYAVVDQPVNLDLFYLAPSKVKPGSNLTYFIAAVNLTQKNVASGVTLTDIAPAGTTVVSAVFDKISCSFFGCSIPNKGTACPINGNVITCNIGSLAPFNTLTGVGVVIVVKVPAATPLNTTLSDTATATSLNRDSDGRDNSVRITTIVKN